MSLSDNIHQLTNEHMTQADDGSFNLMPPLLAELRAASGSTLGASGNGSGGMGMIVNSKAVALETEIREKVQFEYFDATGEECGAKWVEVLKHWAKYPEDSAWHEYFDDYTTKWVTDIRAMLTSRRPPWRPTLDCPSCGHRYQGPDREQCLWVEYWDHDKDTMAHPNQWFAGCKGCGSEWSGDNLKWLPAATREKELTQPR